MSSKNFGLKKGLRPNSLKTFAQLLGIRTSHDIAIQGFAIDSRLVKPGDLFFALPGKRVDGHDYLHEAKQRGAAAAIVQKAREIDLPLLQVPDVLDALQLAAKNAQAERGAKIVAITGSYGKTTTKEFCATLFKQKYKIFASPASYNSQVTLPLTILLAEGNEDFLILEMGMSQPGNLQKLIEIAPPDIALITAIAWQHANSFEEGLLGIAKEKATLFSHKKTELGLYPYACAHEEVVKASAGCQKRSFSTMHEEADYRLQKETLFFQKSALTSLAVEFSLPAYRHNLLAACAVALESGLDLESIKKGIGELKLPAMRFERIEKKGILFINDAYNANPHSVCEALRSLPEPKPGGKKIAALSEMDALGAHALEGHTQVAQAALDSLDLLLCVGEKCEPIQKLWLQQGRGCELFSTRHALEERLQQLVSPGDVVLLKGARSYAMERILEKF
jgi:UDP-N-acetylmuramoyl-tripeptide--D-alanyl-D-alanine ligase